jgi:hypothetical protein
MKCKNDTNKDHCHGCDKQCHDGKKATFYKIDPASIQNAALDGSDQQKVMTEIVKHGSVIGGLSVYSNWQGWVKKHGPDAVYDSHENSTHLGAHCIKIIGFGTSKGKNYWLVQNSWGSGFGDAGTIKMLRGEDPSKSGGDRCLWNKADWAMPIKPTDGQQQIQGMPSDVAAWTTPSPPQLPLEKKTGGWTKGDHTHSFWRELARQIFKASEIAGDFVDLQEVESQVTAGFNARFTVTSTAGLRAVITSAHGTEFELLATPSVVMRAAAPIP